MQGIFHPQWTTHFRPTVATAELATIKITRNTGDGGFTEDGWVDGTSEVIYEGKARWQKIGVTTKRDFTEDFAQFNRVRVQISMVRVDAYYEALGKTFDGFRPNDKIELIENKSNPQSVGDVSYIWGDPTSSNAWHYTINAQENKKQEG